MVNITIDGKQFEVPENTTVLNAARMAGVTIPTLCDHKSLAPYGGCRLCLVEVEGARTLQPSCTLPVNNNMIVHTDTDRTREARKFVLSLIFSERNHFCMFCQESGGDCELQNAAYHEGMTHWPLSPNYQPYAIDSSNPYFVLDHNRCILCRRCVRACSELVGNFTLGFEERGANSILVADLGRPLGDSSCISCGACVQICPTGALIDRDSAYRGKDVQAEHTQSICTGCSVGCSMDVLSRDNQLVRIDGNWDAPLNGGLLCKVGRFLPLNDQRERLVTPLVRKNGSQKAATWDEALKTAGEAIKTAAKKNGVAAIASTRLSAEALSSFKQIFADQLHADVVTSTEEGAYTANAHALAKEFGKPFEGNLAALKKADCVVTLGADVIANHEVVSFFIKRNLPVGTKLIVIDSQANALTEHTRNALKPTKGSEAELLFGLAALIAHSGKGKEQPQANLDSYSAEFISKKTGIAVAELEDAARIIADSKAPYFLFGDEANASISLASLKALVELARVSGALQNASILSVKGQANSLAASLYDLEKPAQIKNQQVVFIALGDETPSQKLIKEAEKASFLIVQASYASALTARADVVLPVGNWSEQTGHFVNLEGKIQVAEKSIEAPEAVLANACALGDLAKELGISINTDWEKALTGAVSSVAIAA